MKKQMLILLMIFCVHAQSPDEYAKTVENYYGHLRQREFKKAYDLLSPVNVEFALGSDKSGKPNFKGSSFIGAEHYDVWLNHIQKLDSVEFIKVEKGKLGNPGDGWYDHTVLGLRCYIVEVREKCIGDYATFSGKNQYFVWLARGADDKIRILGIGTGP